jgi:Protein of unknown function DUF262
MDRPRRSEYTPTDLLSFRESGALEITPKFQRRGVWRLPQRSYFIDSLLRGMPVPPLYLRETQSEDFSRQVRQVIDGQQRIRAVLDYIDGGYSLRRSMDGPWAGKPFAHLDQEHRDVLLNYHFAAEVFIGISDAEVLDIFSRMNTYSVQLNKQELRNGKYFGRFKQVCYSLAYDHLEFWRTARIFTENAIARMLEVELTSELVILILDGPQDKKAAIDRFYADFDDDFPDAERAASRFRSTVDLVNEIIEPKALADTSFRSVPMFYSLFGAVYHARYGSTLDAPSFGRALREREREALRSSILKLSAVLEEARDDDAEIPSRYQRFVTASLRQTDNIAPRRTRMLTILSEAFLV